MPALPTLQSPSLGTLKYTGSADARGNPIYKDSKGNLITRQGNQNVLSKSVNPVASGTSGQTTGQPSTQVNTFQAVLNDPTQAPIKKFSAAVGDMMLQYQNARTNSVYSGDKALSKLQEEGTSKILQETPDELKAFSPSSQAAIRSASAGEGSGQYDVYGDAIKRNDAASRAFLEVKDSIVSQAKDTFGNELNKPSDALLKNYQQLLQNGSITLSDIPKEALPFVVESLDPSKLPKSIAAQTDELKLIDLKNKINGLGPLTPQEEIELKQYVQENYAQADQKAAMDYLTGKQTQAPTPIKNDPTKITELTAGQQTLFNNIVNQYNKSPLVAASDRTPVLNSAIAEVEKEPGNAAKQLNLVYSYVQALDTYQSAVREGELGLVNSIDSKVGQLSSEVQKIQNGQIVRPEVAKQIAAAAKILETTIKTAAGAKAKSYASQAKVLGLEKQWNDYIGGFTASYSDKPTTTGNSNYNGITLPH